MSKRLILVLTLAFVVGIAFAAYAEVQNVKVSGDLTVYGTSRKNYSISNAGASKVANVGSKLDSRDNYTSITRLKVDADLTDNVIATVRLINERDWMGVSTTGQGTTEANQSAIDIDLAYVTLKEFLYSPLTLKVGRQELRIGSALVIGNGVITDMSGLLENDLTSRKAFDAILATLDYDPLILNIGTAKLVESVKSSSDDADAYVVDAIYKFGGKNNVVADASFILAHNSSNTGTAYKGIDTNVVDLRLTADPLKNLSTELEYAFQFGKAGTSTIDRNLRAWALTVGANYAFADVKYTPKLGVKYDYRSGDKISAANPDNVKAWQGLYEDQVNGVIFDPNSNISIIKVSGSMKPMEDVILNADYYNYRYAQKAAAASTTRKGKKDAGDEVDLSLVYNYTEDVSFGLLGAMFWPGDYVDGKTATEVLGSMKVTF